ncbi:MAG: UV damage repair protein UvrX, partial [Bacillota bacterium]
MAEENIDYSSLPDKNILCIDMKSFYASIEAVDRGLDPWNIPLAVIGN